MGNRWILSWHICHNPELEYPPYLATTTSCCFVAGILGTGAEHSKLGDLPVLKPEFIFGQCQYYGNKRSKFASIILTVSIAAVFGSFEVGIIFALKVRSLLLYDQRCLDLAY